MDHQYAQGHTPIYKCPQQNCQKQFKSLFSLKRHQYLHKNEKKYVCDVCHKTFALYQYLKEHSYIHTGELPYLCGINGCNQRFRQACKLCVHKKTHQEYFQKEKPDDINQEVVQMSSTSSLLPAKEEACFFDFSSYFIKIRKHIAKKRESYYMSTLGHFSKKRYHQPREDHCMAKKCWPASKRFIVTREPININVIDS
jgi:hypothetical protein